MVRDRQAAKDGTKERVRSKSNSSGELFVFIGAYLQFSLGDPKDNTWRAYGLVKAKVDIIWAITALSAL